MTRPATARIALNRPLRRLFDYLVPAHLEVQPGQRVKVPFGRQALTGLVVETGVEPPAGITLKPVREILEDWPALPENTFRLLTWASDYYQHPLGECLFTALPPALRRGRPAHEKAEEHWFPLEAEVALAANAHKQKALFETIKDQPGITSSSLVQLGYTRAQIRNLESKSLIAQGQAPRQPTPQEADELPGPSLSPAQQKAADQLPDHTDQFSATLLHGITGSGKTELYLHYLKSHLKADQQALVLVPEINLTPQTLARFRRYFGDRIAVWHSALNDGERLRTWLKIRNGEPVILIGTRSAVLLPFTNLRTLIVDEEHDSSYKQGDGFRYSGRDVAVYRACLLYTSPSPRD